MQVNPAVTSIANGNINRVTSIPYLILSVWWHVWPSRAVPGLQILKLRCSDPGSNRGFRHRSFKICYYFKPLSIRSNVLVSESFGLGSGTIGRFSSYLRNRKKGNFRTISCWAGIQPLSGISGAIRGFWGVV